MSRTLYIVDISSYIFRAYYAIKSLKTSKGIPTNATYGVVSMMHKLIRDKKPDHLVLAFDSPSPGFRKTIYEAYKANRPPPPEDLPAQFDHIKEFVDAYGLPRLEMAGFEADDIIASLVRCFQKEGVETVIVSADKDLMQLIGPGVKMYDSMRERWITEKEVKEKFGVTPKQVVDVLALAGDASDNIPGVKGIGEKTAAKLIEQYGTLENLLDHAAEVKGKVGENLLACRGDAILSKELATLHCEVPMNCSWGELEFKAPPQKRLNEFYRSLEFYKLIEGEDAEQEAGEQETGEPGRVQGHEALDRAKYDLILTESDLSSWVTLLRKSGEFAFDTETDSLDPHTAHLVGLSFAVGGGKACYVPVRHQYLGCPDQLPLEKVVGLLKPLLEDPTVLKYGQNAKFDMSVLAQVGITVKGLAGDSMLASYLIDAESPHNLDRLAKEYLNHENLRFSEVVAKGETFAGVDVKTACQYAAEDADVTFRLIKKLTPLISQYHLDRCYREIEVPLEKVLFEMEKQGVYVDVPFLSQLGKEFSSRLDILQKEICEHAGCEFNLNSPKQVADVLFVKLMLPSQRKTKTGESTDVDVLNELASQHPVPRLLLEYRMLTKLKTTYVDSLVKLAHPATSRVHTCFNQTVAATGRLSSTEPNLQNIPIRTEEGRRIREAFAAPAGHVLLSADYSQIELRLLAAFCGDENMIGAFERDEDVHHMTAQKIFGKKPEEVTKEMRGMAKTVNFGVIYGQSAFGLAKQLNISNGEAKEFIDGFYKHFPSVQEYRKKVLEEALKTGEVRTWMGRRRLVPDLTSKNHNLRQNAERMAFNTVFQGSAADLIKVAMIQINADLKKGGLKSIMILQVHDELILEVPLNEVEEVKKLVVHDMETAIKSPVRLKVDTGTGENWARAH